MLKPKERVDISWMRHAGSDEASRDAVRQALVNARPAFELLIVTLKARLAEQEISSSTDYDKPSWPFYRADKDGYKRALKDVLDLIPFEEVPDHGRHNDDPHPTAATHTKRTTNRKGVRDTNR